MVQGFLCHCDCARKSWGHLGFMCAKSLPRGTDRISVHEPHPSGITDIWDGGATGMRNFIPVAKAAAHLLYRGSFPCMSFLKRLKLPQKQRTHDEAPNTR